jgi:hypothetical protein
MSDVVFKSLLHELLSWHGKGMNHAQGNEKLEQASHPKRFQDERHEHGKDKLHQQ